MRFSKSATKNNEREGAQPGEAASHGGYTTYGAWAEEQAGAGPVEGAKGGLRDEAITHAALRTLESDLAAATDELEPRKTSAPLPAPVTTNCTCTCTDTASCTDRRAGSHTGSTNEGRDQAAIQEAMLEAVSATVQQIRDETAELK